MQTVYPIICLTHGTKGRVRPSDLSALFILTTILAEWLQKYKYPRNKSLESLKEGFTVRRMSVLFILLCTLLGKTSYYAN